jgi:hypothetical protein
VFRSKVHKQLKIYNLLTSLNRIGEGKKKKNKMCFKKNLFRRQAELEFPSGINRLSKMKHLQSKLLVQTAETRNNQWQSRHTAPGAMH